MPNLKKTLKIKLEGAGQVLVLAVGSELRGDDAAGILVGKNLQKSCSGPRLEILFGGSAPENLTGEIKKLRPSHLIIVDSAEMGLKPGSVKLIAPDEVGGYSFSTHVLPLKIMVDYLLKHFACEIIIIGIQPKNLDFGASVSPEVEAAARKVSKFLDTSL
jgi:hydrogenase 3 maturation protease